MGEQRPDGGGTGGDGDGRFYGWPSSRIVRVSRATGGKDRHSKILTSKGTRDRRVRLSVNTAIQFYDLQDRLGYDQPSKAVEWLLTAAASSIAELPPMNCSFLVNPKQLSSAKMSAGAGGFQLGLDSAEVEIGRRGGDGGRGSGNSKNSKDLGISISRSDNRIKAGEKAKEKENEPSYVASFTELLSGKISSVNGGGHSSNSANSDELIHQDYFTGGLGLPPDHRHHHQQELQPFSFSGHNLVSSPAINRGTLQSNSPLPRFPPEDGGSPPNFFIGGDHRHHFLSGFDARLQLYYGQKEEEKN